MPEDINKEYRENMQELMLELKFSTDRFLKKLKEKTAKKIKQLKIPIVISVKGEIRELEKDLFGIGEKIIEPEIQKIPGLENLNVINSNYAIMEGIIFSRGRKQFFREQASQKTEYDDNNYILYISETISNIEECVKTVAEWLFGKILNHKCKIIIEEKEIFSQEELQNILKNCIQNS